MKAALDLAKLRLADNKQVNLGSNYDTALDSQGVLHVAFYDSKNERLMYVTRSLDGRWSDPQVVDSAKKVGYFASIAVDNTGKVGISYYDAANTNLKYASFNGSRWYRQTVDTSGNVGTYTSLVFDINGNAYIAYHKKSGGDLKLAKMVRDTEQWTRTTVDNTSKDVGTYASIDIAEVAMSTTRSGFTIYDTTVAIAYADAANGNLKYARLDLDDTTATWYVTTVDDLRGVANIDLDLHVGPTSSDARSPQAQIAYQDTANKDVKYAYRVNSGGVDWAKQTIAAAGDVGATVGLSFDADDLPAVTYYNTTKRGLYTATRNRSSGVWSATKIGTTAAVASVGFNERTGGSIAVYLDRSKKNVFADVLV